MARGPHVLAIDAGTTALKAALVVDGAVVDLREEPYELSHPRPGWAEQDPGDWWRACVRAVRALRPAHVDVIGCTGQMQDLVLLGAAGPAGPAILYSDQRAVAEHRDLLGEVGAAAGARGWADAAGAEPDVTGVAPKWRWLQRCEPERAAAAEVVLLGAHSVVTWHLTGVAACDHTTAASSGLCEVAGGAGPRWWPLLVDRLGVPLPQLVAPDAVTGPLRAGPAGELALEPGTPVVHGPGDALATTLGVSGTHRDEPYAYLGTSGWVAVLRPADAPRAPGTIWLPALRADERVAAAPMLTAGAAADWARGSLLGGITIDQLDLLASGSCAAAEGVAFLPHLDGVRVPVSDADATGALVGVRRTSGAGVVAAAVYEGVAHALRGAAEAVAPGAAAVALCGGGSRSDVWAQVIADVLDRPVHRVGDEHAAVRGAASCAHLALGLDPLAPAERLASFRPRPDRVEHHRRLARVFDALGPALAPAFAALAAVRGGEGPGAPGAAAPGSAGPTQHPLHQHHTNGGEPT